MINDLQGTIPVSAATITPPKHHKNSVGKSGFKGMVLVALTGLMFAASASAATAETFTSQEFLKWSHAGQISYIDASIGMAGLIAARNDREQGDCLENWYFGNQDVANEEILSTMQRFPTYHPRGVIVALMEKYCGSIIYID